MSYDNSFKLSMSGGELIVETQKCPECGYIGDSKFCPECGTKMENGTYYKLIDIYNVISEFRDFSEDASYLLDEEGGEESSGNGYNIKDDLVKFSKKYPDILFELYCEWDSGFGDPDTKFYVRNGKSYSCHAKMIFPDFDENKLK